MEADWGGMRALLVTVLTGVMGSDSAEAERGIARLVLLLKSQECGYGA